MKVTQKDWESKGRELFGDDKSQWRFVCPSCGNIASVQLAKEKWPEVKGKDWSVTQECIGRYTDQVDCNWAAYGLFRGPVFVDPYPAGKEIPIFDFEGKPFTSQSG